MEGHHLHILAAGLTDVGKARHHNEDNILVRHDLGIFLVSDGMGGHNAGEVASALTIASVRNFFEATSVDEFIDDDADECAAEARRLSAAVSKANSDVHEISTTHRKHRGMGCTLVILDIQLPWIHIAHLGDSRCYRIRDSKIEQLTRDHSLISDILAIKPDISEDDLAHLPKNIVTRAVGLEPTVPVSVRSEECQPKDIYLLCSDGLTGMLPDAQILETILSTPEPHTAASKLIQSANQAGGLDNISAVIVRLDWTADAAAITQPPPALSPQPPSTEPEPPPSTEPEPPPSTKPEPPPSTEPEPPPSTEPEPPPEPPTGSPSDDPAPPA